MKVAVVFDTPHEGWEDADFKREVAAEVDEPEYEVAEALMANRHEVLLVGVNSDLMHLVNRLREFQPDLVFNCAEGFHGDAQLDYVFPALLEAEGFPYTGAPPIALLTTRDKAMSKQVLAFHGIKVPGFATYHVGQEVREPPSLRFPLIVKPLQEDASEGIARASVVQTLAALAERVAFVHQRFAQPAIAEEFVEGRELYVGAIGNGDRLQLLPVVELVFDPERTRREERIATKMAKWDVEYRERKGIKNVIAEGISAEAMDRIEAMSRAAFRALWLRDYARFDIRLTPDGEAWVIEANANPFISFGHDMANAAERAGMTYHDFVERLVGVARERYGRPA
jgi:D-alanine-D-alanine ligase